MKTIAIVEIEEGGLVATVAALADGELRVERVVQLPLAELGRDSLLATLRAPAAECLRGIAGIHVVIGERRMAHHVCRMPRMKAEDLNGVAAREALRLTGMPTRAEVLWAPWLVPPVAGPRLSVAVTALARSVWEPLYAAFQSAELPVLGLYSAESCMAAAVRPEHGEMVAVLESNVGRARFVLCESGAPVQVRRFMLGAEPGSEAMMAQLAMELPRTLEWLRESGHRLPRTLLLGSRLGIAAGAAGMLEGDGLVVIDGRDSPLTDPAGSPVSLGAAALLERLRSGKGLPSMLDAPQLELPWSRSRWTGLAAAALVGVCGAASAVVDFRELQAVRETRPQLALELRQAQTRLVQAQRAAQAHQIRDPEQERLLAILAQRRPISRLVADVCEATHDEVRLEELRFANADALVLIGTVEGRSRQEALAALARFGRSLRALPFLDTNRQEEVGEGAAGTNRFRFKITLQWRKA